MILPKGKISKPELIMQYYRDRGVQFDIARYCYRREVAIIHSKIGNKSDNRIVARMQRIHNRRHVDYLLTNRWDMETGNKNVYASLAVYKNGIPRDDEKVMAEVWNTTHTRYIEEFDFLLDIDAGSWKNILLIKQATIKIVHWLRNHAVPHTVLFSGCGYHIRIRGREFPPYKDLMRHYAIVARFFKSMVGDCVDTRIYDWRRVAKVANTLSFHKHGIMVCHPFDADTGELEATQPETLKLENYLKSRLAWNVGTRNPEPYSRKSQSMKAINEAVKGVIEK